MEINFLLNYITILASFIIISIINNNYLKQLQSDSIYKYDGQDNNNNNSNEEHDVITVHGSDSEADSSNDSNNDNHNRSDKNSYIEDGKLIEESPVSRLIRRNQLGFNRLLFKKMVEGSFNSEKDWPDFLYSKYLVSLNTVKLRELVNSHLVGSKSPDKTREFLRVSKCYIQYMQETHLVNCKMRQDVDKINSALQSNSFTLINEILANNKDHFKNYPNNGDSMEADQKLIILRDSLNELIKDESNTRMKTLMTLYKEFYQHAKEIDKPPVPLYSHTTGGYVGHNNGTINEKYVDETTGKYVSNKKKSLLEELKKLDDNNNNDNDNNDDSNNTGGYGGNNTGGYGGNSTGGNTNISGSSNNFSVIITNEQKESPIDYIIDIEDSQMIDYCDFYDL